MMKSSVSLFAALMGISATALAQPTSSPPADVMPTIAETTALASAFNADADKVRVIILAEPG